MARAAPGEWSFRNAVAAGRERTILTGIPHLDAATGGIPYGAITEIFGEDSCGKTSLALVIAAAAQRSGGVAVYIDVEHGLDAQLARTFGVDPDELLLARPENGEQAQQMAELLMQNRCADLIVFDSIAAMPPGDAAEGEFAQSRMVSRMLGQLAWRARMSNTALVLVNHLRGRSAEVVGDRELAAGGWTTALRSSLRLRLERTAGRAGDEETPGGSIRIQVVKNARGRGGIEVAWAHRAGSRVPGKCAP